MPPNDDLMDCQLTLAEGYTEDDLKHVFFRNDGKCREPDWAMGPKYEGGNVVSEVDVFKVQDDEDGSKIFAMITLCTPDVARSARTIELYESLADCEDNTVSGEVVPEEAYSFDCDTKCVHIDENGNYKDTKGDDCQFLRNIAINAPSKSLKFEDQDLTIPIGVCHNAALFDPSLEGLFVRASCDGGEFGSAKWFDSRANCASGKVSSEVVQLEAQEANCGSDTTICASAMARIAAFESADSNCSNVPTSTSVDLLWLDRCWDGDYGTCDDSGAVENHKVQIYNGCEANSTEPNVEVLQGCNTEMNTLFKFECHQLKAEQTWTLKNKNTRRRIGACEGTDNSCIELGAQEMSDLETLCKDVMTTQLNIDKRSTSCTVAAVENGGAYTLQATANMESETKQTKAGKTLTSIDMLEELKKICDTEANTKLCVELEKMEMTGGTNYGSAGESDDGLSTAALLLIIFGVALALIGIVLLFIKLWQRRSQENKEGTPDRDDGSVLENLKEEDIAEYKRDDMA